MCLGGGKGGEKLRIAVGGKDKCIGIGSVIGLDLVKWNVETVNDGIGAACFLHSLQQDGQYIFAASIMMTKNLTPRK